MNENNDLFPISIQPNPKGDNMHPPPTSEPYQELLTDDPWPYAQQPPLPDPVHNSPDTSPTFTTAERIQRVLSIPDGQPHPLDALLADLPPKRFLTTTEVAEALGISRATVWRRVKRKKLRPLAVDGPHSAFRVEDVMNLLPTQPGQTGPNSTSPNN